MSRAQPILPGSTIGVLGGGQLGRMFAMAARRLGYRVHTLAPEHDTPTGQIADVEIKASYDDLDRIREFARGVDVVTFEFENVSAAATAVAEEHAVVRPNGHALYVAQHRLREKTFLTECGLPVTPFAPVASEADLAAAVAALGRPSVLKTASFGYDGKGQARLGPDDDPVRAWEGLGRQEAVGTVGGQGKNGRRDEDDQNGGKRDRHEPGHVDAAQHLARALHAAQRARGDPARGSFGALRGRHDHVQGRVRRRATRPEKE